MPGKVGGLDAAAVRQRRSLSRRRWSTSTARIRASTSSPRTTASASTTWWPTTENTTRPTATATRDGTDDNLSWNCGWEGDAGVPPEVLALRRQQVKNFCALLMLANGTPMFCAGDEFLNTQRGNNNPYNQDNEITWLDWDRLERNRDMFRFFKLHDRVPQGAPVDRPQPRSGARTCTGTAPTGRSTSRPKRARWPTACAAHSENDNDLYVMINAHWEDADFAIQEELAAGSA